MLGTSSAGGHLVEQYTFTGTHDVPYISSITTLGTSYDCGYMNGYVWAACNISDSPVRAYNTSGALVSYIPGAIVFNAARGVEFDANGYLWVSNPTTDKIYKIGMTGIEGGAGAPVPAGLQASCNPFESSTVISGGFGRGSTLEVYDASGRVVLESSFDGTMTLDGSTLPDGAYMVRVRDGSTSQTLRLVKF